MVWVIETEETIRAPPEAVWSVLTDVDAYAEWNPTTSAATGDPELGNRLHFRLSLPGGLALPYRPIVIVVDPRHELRWRADLGPDLVIAEHGFRVDTVDDDVVRVVQRAHLEGTLADRVGGRFGDRIRRGLERQGEALARRVEGESERPS